MIFLVAHISTHTLAFTDLSFPKTKFTSCVQRFLVIKITVFLVVESWQLECLNFWMMFHL